jgi:toxin ParE1/3/4
MEIRWSPEAAVDLAGIVEYIRTQNPSAADGVARTIYDSVVSLESFPRRGRPGRVEGTRELVLSPLPFIVVYRIKQNIVEAVPSAARLTTLAVNKSSGKTPLAIANIMAWAPQSIPLRFL